MISATGGNFFECQKIYSSVIYFIYVVLSPLIKIFNLIITNSETKIN